MFPTNDRHATRVRGVPTVARLALAFLVSLPCLAVPSAHAQTVNSPPTGNGEAPFPTLAEVLARAEQRAPAAIEARGEVAAARAGKVGAEVSAFGNPYVDFQVDRGSTTKDVQALAYLYMPVDAFGQRGARIEEADALVRWKGLSAEARRSAVRGEAVARWGAARAAQERLMRAQAAVETSEKEAAYFAARFVAKDTTIYEKSLAEAEVGRWKQARAEAELDLLERLARLAEWMGEARVPAPSKALSGDAARTVDGDSLAPLPPARSRASATLLGEASRAGSSQPWPEAPALVAQRAEHFFWEKQGERYRAERRAPLQLLLIAGRGDPGDVRLGGGVTVTLPVARRNQGEIARAEAEADRSAAAEASLAASLAARIAATEQALTVLLATIANLDSTGLPASERAVDASLEAYRSGKMELLPVLVARRELQLARTRRLDLVERAWRTYGEWIALTGEKP